MAPQRRRKPARQSGGDTACRAALIRVIQRPVEPVQDVVDQMGAVVVGLHAVGEQHVHGVVRGNALEVLAKHAVQATVDLADRAAAQPRGQSRVVMVVLRIMQVPHLVADAVALAEDVEKEVPPTAVEQLERRGSLDLNFLAQRPEHCHGLLRGPLLAGPQRIVARGELRFRPRVGGVDWCAVPRLELVGQLRRPRGRPEMPVVAGELGDHHPVDRTHDAVRDVENRDAMPGVGQVLPQWAAADLVDRGLAVLVGATHDLVPAPVAVAIGFERGEERRPVGADEHALGSHRGRDRSLAKHARQGRQLAVGDHLSNQVGTDRVEGNDHRAGLATALGSKTAQAGTMSSTAVGYQLRCVRRARHG